MVPRSGWTAVWPPSTPPTAHGRAGIVGPGDQRVVRALAVGHADRVDRRQVEDVEAEVGQGRQLGLDALQPAPRAGEQLVPGAEAGPLGVDVELERPWAAWSRRSDRGGRRTAPPGRGRGRRRPGCGWGPSCPRRRRRPRRWRCARRPWPAWPPLGAAGRPRPARCPGRPGRRRPCGGPRRATTPARRPTPRSSTSSGPGRRPGSGPPSARPWRRRRRGAAGSPARAACPGRAPSSGPRPAAPRGRRGRCRPRPRRSRPPCAWAGAARSRPEASDARSGCGRRRDEGRVPPSHPYPALPPGNNGGPVNIVSQQVSTELASVRNATSH